MHRTCTLHGTPELIRNFGDKQDSQQGDKHFVPTLKNGQKLH